MTEPATDEPLDFQRAQFDEPPPARTCQRCKQPLIARYFSLNGHAVCVTCLSRAQQQQRSSFPKALLLGSAAGAVSALLYYGYRVWQESEWAIFTILIGIAVGIGVRMGAGSSRSVGYRVLAVVLTWFAMCSTYVPAILGSFDQGAERHSPLAVAIAFVISLQIPLFFISSGEVLSLLIFAFGLWEAFRLSAPRPFIVEGPFEPTTAKP